jgi:uncharacterized membrane protein YobD (UPF0266 family)
VDQMKLFGEVRSILFVSWLLLSSAILSVFLDKFVLKSALLFEDYILFFNDHWFNWNRIQLICEVYHTVWLIVR